MKLNKIAITIVALSLASITFANPGWKVLDEKITITNGSGGRKILHGKEKEIALSKSHLKLDKKKALKMTMLRDHIQTDTILSEFFEKTGYAAHIFANHSITLFNYTNVPQIFEVTLHLKCRGVANHEQEDISHIELQPGANYVQSITTYLTVQEGPGSYPIYADTRVTGIMNSYTRADNRLNIN